MPKNAFSKRIRPVLFGLLSFVLSLVLFALSFCLVLEATILNPDFILDNMNSTNYYTEKKDEITQSLVDLGYASGLSEDFFSEFVDEIMINNNARDYILNYYDGMGAGSKIDTTEFEQSFNKALDEYIKENNIDAANTSGRDYLVTKAALIYRKSLELPMFASLSAYILKLKSAMPFVIAGLGVFALIIGLILFFANSWKHRAVKYYCYAFATAFLTVGMVPAAAFFTNQFAKINLSSRALYNMFISAGNNTMIALLFCSLFFLVIAVSLFFQYRRMRKKLVTD